ncbi:hypothetical protein TNCV_1398721 [Trichonephila clavipes]|nr:hypothetical protein TNCV_1398721 [Trichonephila clavipes]
MPHPSHPKRGILVSVQISAEVRWCPIMLKPHAVTNGDQKILLQFWKQGISISQKYNDCSKEKFNLLLDVKQSLNVLRDRKYHASIWWPERKAEARTAAKLNPKRSPSRLPTAVNIASARTLNPRLSVRS